MAVDVEKFRIGELARRVGATPRTVRYYEEIGLLPGGDRPEGTHRLYDATDEARLRDLLRIRDLLGLSLADLSEWVAAEDARARPARALERRPGARRRHRGRDPARGARAISSASWSSCAARRTALEELEDELAAKRRRMRDLLRVRAGGRRV